MAGVFCEGRQERKLRATVAFPERMNGIQLSKEMRRSDCKCRSIQSSEMPLLRQVAKQPSHFSIDVLRIAEGAALFGNAHRPDLAGPGKHVLK